MSLSISSSREAFIIPIKASPLEEMRFLAEKKIVDLSIEMSGLNKELSSKSNKIVLYKILKIVTILTLVGYIYFNRKEKEVQKKSEKLKLQRQLVVAELKENRDFMKNRSTPPPRTEKEEDLISSLRQLVETSVVLKGDMGAKQDSDLIKYLKSPEAEDIFKSLLAVTPSNEPRVFEDL